MADELLANATPRPWGPDLRHVLRFDSRGGGYVDTADAALIVRAVNEYEALRAVEEAARSAIPFGSWVSDEGPVHVNAQALADLASALAALDKARKPA